MTPSESTVPDVMPINREAWFKELHLSNFVNTYYQYRDVTRWIGPEPTVLIIGPGQGLDTQVLKWRRCRVTTFDIDRTFMPDIVGSCHDMPMFGNAQFDVVIASHVLEHLPVRYLDQALAEIARVGRHAVVYLPVAGRQMLLRFAPGFKNLDWTSLIDIRRFWERPDGIHAKYCAGQHYWEIGYRGYRLRDVCRRLETEFEMLQHYRNKDWPSSHNFVMRSRRHTHAIHAPSREAVS